MKALIFDGKVVQIGAAEFPVAPALQWIDISGVSPAPDVGWSYDGATFTPPPPPPFTQLKAAKRRDFITEGVTRIAAQVPDLDTLESIKAVAAIWPEIGAGARAVLATAKNIYLYFTGTIPPKLAAVTTQAELDAIDPTAADPFGDGTPWPT